MVLQGQRILVTGGGGFMGSRLCEMLIEAGAKVRVLDNFSSGRPANLVTLGQQLQLVQGSVADAGMVRKACRGVEAVVHVAFPMTLREQSLAADTVADCMTGLYQVLQGALDNNALLVYISSIAVYGNPQYVPVDENHPLEPVMLHGAMKVSGEFMCRTLANSHGLKTVILRVADVYGPKNTRISVPVRFLINALQGRPIQVFGSGRQSRTYTFVDDYARAVLKALTTPATTGQILNIACDQSITMDELAQLVQEVTGSQSEIIREPGTPADDRQLIIDNTLAKRILQPGPFVSLRDGLTITRDWLQQNWDYYR